MRLLNHVEGVTEETFTNEILAPHLIDSGYESVSARLIGNARLRSHRGGARAWSDVKQDIVRHLRSDQGAIATTMVDYYALPASGPKEWPGRASANQKQFAQKAQTVQSALLNDVVSEMGDNFDQQSMSSKVYFSVIAMRSPEELEKRACPTTFKKLGTSLTPQRRSTIRRIPHHRSGLSCCCLATKSRYLQTLRRSKLA